MLWMEQIQCILTKSVIKLKPTFGNSANLRFSVLYWKTVFTVFHYSLSHEFLIGQRFVFWKAFIVYPSIPWLQVTLQMFTDKLNYIETKMFKLIINQRAVLEFAPHVMNSRLKLQGCIELAYEILWFKFPCKIES